MRHIHSASKPAALAWAVLLCLCGSAGATTQLFCPNLISAPRSTGVADTTITPSNQSTAVFEAAPPVPPAIPALPPDFPRFGSPAQRAVLASRYAITDLERCFACGFEAQLYRYVSGRGESRVLKLARPGKQEERDSLVEEVRLAEAARNAGATAAAPLTYDPDVNGVHRPHYLATLLDLLPTYRVKDVPSAKRAIVLIRSLALNLRAMHRVRITFRDLTPKNIFIDFSGRPVLTDFGIASQGGPGHANLPKGILRGSATGTLSYMSPEQQLAEDPIPAHDLFALGVVAWEIMVGNSISQPVNPRHCRKHVRTFDDQTGTYFRIAASPATAVPDFPRLLEPLSAVVMLPVKTADDFLDNLLLAETAIAKGEPNVFFGSYVIQQRLAKLLDTDSAVFADSIELWRRLNSQMRAAIVHDFGWPDLFW